MVGPRRAMEGGDGALARAYPRGREGPRAAVAKAFDRWRRWHALRTDPAYVADWHAHAGPLVLEAPPFRFRRQTEEDLRRGALEAARVGGAAPRALRRMPFWADVAMFEGRAVYADGDDRPTLRGVMLCSGATFWGLRLRDGGLVLRLSHEGRVAQICVHDGSAFDPGRSGLEIARRGAHSTRWIRLNRLDGPVFPRKRRRRP